MCRRFGPPLPPPIPSLWVGLGDGVAPGDTSASCYSRPARGVIYVMTLRRLAFNARHSLGRDFGYALWFPVSTADRMVGPFHPRSYFCGGCMALAVHRRSPLGWGLGGKADTILTFFSLSSTMDFYLLTLVSLFTYLNLLYQFVQHMLTRVSYSTPWHLSQL